jgi:hypothetical protein
MDDIFILHLCVDEHKDEGTENEALHLPLYYFCWERLPIRLTTPRFHFGTALLKDDIILVLGGLESTKDLLHTFTDNGKEEKMTRTEPLACKIGESSIHKATRVPQTDAQLLDVKITDSLETTGGDGLSSRFAMSCCMLLSKSILVVTGGVCQHPRNQSPNSPIQTYWVSKRTHSKNVTVYIERIALQLDLVNHVSDDVDFGSMVHHCCVPVSDNELLLVGGGVSSFAFGECYAK